MNFVALFAWMMRTAHTHPSFLLLFDHHKFHGSLCEALGEHYE